MKLDPIKRENLEQAAAILSAKPSQQWSLYWLQMPDGSEYQFKEIVRLAYKLATNQEIDKTFQSNNNYRGWITREFGYPIVFHVPNHISFFTADDVDFYKGFAKKKYRKTNDVAVEAGKRIKKTLFDKTTLWMKTLELQGWKIDMDNKWQISGTFKPYSWARVYKQKDFDAKVYFTFGVDSYRNALVYKLDCQKKQYTPKNALTPLQVQAFERVVNGTGAQWNEIHQTLFIDYNWKMLRDETLDFIGRYEFLYDEAVEAVRQATVVSPQSNSSNSLEVVAPPILTHNSLPKKSYTFQGITIDYDAEHKNKKYIGNGGEDLVLQKEIDFLNHNGLAEYAKKVEKVKDGRGYDIRSFDINKNEIFIEVKTTTGLNIRPFMMTDNEWEFMKKHSDRYVIYRIYNFDKVNKTGKMFYLYGDIENQVFIRTKQIEVFLKSLTTP